MPLGRNGIYGFGSRAIRIVVPRFDEVEAESLVEGEDVGVVDDGGSKVVGARW